MKTSLTHPTNTAARFLGALLIAVSPLFTACKTKTVDPPAPVRSLTSAEARIVDNANAFAFRIFSRVSQAEESKNVFISPLSIATALTMAYNGTNTSTREAFRKTLDFGVLSDEEINQSYQSLSRLLVEIDPGVQFRAANSLWHNQRLDLQKPFELASQTYFDATTRGLNFADPNAKNVINEWVAKKTNGKIKDLVDNVTPEHLLFLINALYFKGTWTYAFDKTKTADGSFALEAGGAATAKFMVLEKVTFRRYQDATKQLVELPYGNQQFSMVFIVPTGRQQVADLVGELSSTNLDQWLNQANSTELDLYVPKFTFSYGKKLNDILSQMGLAEAFGSNADLSRMIEGFGQGDAKIDEVMHKAFVEVNEEGTTAAAATSVGVVPVSLPPSIRLDRPFVFLIREKATNTLLFAGKLMNPTVR